jgi:hypothetical protein
LSLFQKQITIPIKYFETLGFENELECIYSGDMLILTPIRNESSAFAEEILEDLNEIFGVAEESED